MKPLVKIARYGSVFEVTRFEKPFVAGSPPKRFSRRSKSELTLKQTQNIWRAKRRLKRYLAVCGFMLGPPAFATFTYTKKQPDISQAIADWRSFTRRMKRSFPHVAFARVPERHKSKGVHFHAAIYGLPEDLPCIIRQLRGRWIHCCSKKRMCERKVRSLAKVWKLGFVDLQKARKPESVAGYVSKYLTKGDPDWTLFGLHVVSCNSVLFSTLARARAQGVFWDLSSHRSPVAVDMAMDDILSHSLHRRARSFLTRWLGTAHHDLYDIY